MENKSIKGNRKFSLAGATTGFFVGFAAVSLFGSTVKTFDRMLDLGPVLVGVLIAIPSLTGSLLRIPFGAWVDTNGGKKPFTIQLIVAIVGMAGLLYTTFNLDSLFAHVGFSLYYILLFFGALAGFGISIFSVGIGQVSYWFKQKDQGKALAIYAGLGNTGPGIFSLIIPAVIVSQGLSFAYVLWISILVLGTGTYVAITRNSWFFQLRSLGAKKEDAISEARKYGQELFPGGTAGKFLLNAAKAPKIWGLVFLYYVSFGGFLALTSWFPVYWGYFMQKGLIAAGILTAAYSLIGSLIRVPGGYLSDKIGGEKTLFLSLMMTIAGAIILFISYTYYASILGEVLMAVGMGVSNAAVFKLVPSYMPSSVGGGSGLIGGIGAFGGFTLPIILGAFAAFYGMTGYAKGFSVFIILAFISLLIAHILNKTKHIAVKGLSAENA